VLDGLTPGTAWDYRLSWRTDAAAAWQQGGIGRFVTARAAGQAFSFVIEADPHLDEATDPQGYAASLRAMAALQPDFVVDLGDSSMVEKLASSEAETRSRNLLLRSFWDNLGGVAPFFMALGNHDGEFGWKARPGAVTPAEAASIRRSLFPNPVPAAGSFYSGISDTAYSFTWGDALFIVLDPFTFTTRKGAGDNWDWTLGKQQYDWLAATLAASTAKYRLVFIHHLVGGLSKDSRAGADAAGLYEWGGGDGTGNAASSFAARRPGWSMPIHDLLVKGRVDVVFHGHDHFYDRETKDGMVYQEVPQPSLRMRQNASQVAAEYRYTSGDVLPSPGFLRVTVGPVQATVELRQPGAAGALRTYTISP